MKKVLLIVVILMVLLTGVLVLGEDVDESGVNDKESRPPTQEEISEEGSDDGAEDGSDLGINLEDELLKENLQKAERDLKNLEEKSKSKLEENIEIPENLRGFSKIVFGFDDSEVSWSVFIVAICLWAVLFFIFWDIVKEESLFGGRLVSIIASFVITSIVALTGIIKKAAEMILNIYDFGFFEKWPIVGIVAAVLTCLLVLFVLSKVIKYLSHRTKLEKVSTTAAKAKAGMEAQAKGLDELSEEK